MKKNCRTCGASYDKAAWSQLKLCGYQPNGRKTAGEVMELRLCTCGTSLALDFGDLPDSFPSVPRVNIDAPKKT